MPHRFPRLRLSDPPVYLVPQRVGPVPAVQPLVEIRLSGLREVRVSGGAQVGHEGVGLVLTHLAYARLHISRGRQRPCARAPIR